MNNLEICQRVANIEDLEMLQPYMVKDIEGEVLLTHKSNRIWCREYDPLTDDALCFGLIVKHRVDVIHKAYGRESTLYTCRIYDDPEDNPIAECSGTDLNKTICLVIIGKHKHHKSKD